MFAHYVFSTGLAANVFGGLAASVLALAAASARTYYRNHLRMAALRRVIPHDGRRLTIICPQYASRPDFSVPMPDELRLSLDDANAIIALHDAASRLGYTMDVISSKNQEAIKYSHAGRILIGGPGTNQIVCDLLDKNCVRCTDAPADRLDSSERATVTLGSHVCQVEPGRSFYVIVRLSPEVLRRNDTALLVWGFRGNDTVAAANFIMKQPKYLARKVKEHDGNLFLVVETDGLYGGVATLPTVEAIADITRQTIKLERWHQPTAVPVSPGTGPGRGPSRPGAGAPPPLPGAAKAGGGASTQLVEPAGHGAPTGG
jgi:hypothetical protein